MSLRRSMHRYRSRRPALNGKPLLCLGSTSIRLLQVEGGEVVFEIGFINRGRGDVPNATVNVLVPATAHWIRRCDYNGTVLMNEGSFLPTSDSLTNDEQGRPIPSIYWNGLVSFPGRVARPVLFRVAFPDRPSEVPIRYTVASSALSEPLIREGTLRVHALAEGA